MGNSCSGRALVTLVRYEAESGRGTIRPTDLTHVTTWNLSEGCPGRGNDTSFLIGSCSALDGLPPPRSTFHWPQEEMIPVVGLALERSAESARGISPRAAHRSGRETLASSGSCHPKEGCRLPSRQGVPPVVRLLHTNVDD